MIILAFDTSSDFGSVALCRNGNPAREIGLERSLEHSQALFRAIDLLLSASRVGFGDIDMFVTARGPGSFTGLRIGMAAAEGLAFATGREAGAVSTLAAMAWTLGESAAWIAPLMDARRGEVYGAVFRREGNRLIEAREGAVARPQDFLDSLPSEEAVVFLGPGVKHCRSGIQMRPRWRGGRTDLLLAAAIGDMARAGHREPFEPLYLRPPAVQPPGRRA